MQVRFSFPMKKKRSSVKLKPEQEEDSQDMSLNHSAAKSPVRITRRKGFSPFDNLLKQCEILSRNNSSKYNNCVELQDKLRLHLTNYSTNSDYKCLKSWLDKAREDYFTMESNYGDLKDIYEVLLKNNFVEKFSDYGETVEKLQFKFLKEMVQCKDLQKSLNAVKDDITSLKSDYKKCSTTEDPLKYTDNQKTLRLKAINVLYECERLNTCMEETCEKITKLNSEYDNLMERYTVLSENTIVKEFLNSANQLENLNLTATNKLNTGSKTVLGQVNKEVASLQKLCITEQKRREEIEKAYNSLDEFSDKICRMLLHHQRLILPNGKTESFLTNIDSVRNSLKKESGSCDTTAVSEFSSTTILRTNISELEDNTEPIDFDDNVQDENEFITHTVFVPDEESVDFSLDSGITAVGNSTELDTSICVETAANFRCNVCNGCYASRQALEDHKRLVHPYKCFVCGKPFPCRNTMKDHLTQFHRKVYSQPSSVPVKKPHKCAVCPKRFRYYREKTRHQRDDHELGDE